MVCHGEDRRRIGPEGISRFGVVFLSGARWKAATDESGLSRALCLPEYFRIVLCVCKRKAADKVGSLFHFILFGTIKDILLILAGFIALVVCFSRAKENF